MASRATPYIEQLLENSDVQNDLRDGVRNLRAAYERSQKRRVKAARDEKLRRQVQAAATSIAAAGKAIAGAGEKPKRRGRKLLAFVGVAAVAGGAAIAASEDLRESIFGGESEDEQAPEQAPVPPSAENVPA